MVVKLISFVRFLGELKIHTYQKDISKLTDLYKNPKIGLRLTKASKLSRSLTFLLFPDQPFHAAARNSGTSRIFFSEICAFYKNCDSHSQNTLALCFLGSKKKVSLCRRDSLLLWKVRGNFRSIFYDSWNFTADTEWHEKFTAFCKNRWYYFFINFSFIGLF